MATALLLLGIIGSASAHASGQDSCVPRSVSRPVSPRFAAPFRRFARTVSATRVRT